MTPNRAGALLALLIATFAAPPTVAADFAPEMVDATFKLFHPDSTATCFFVRREAPDTGLYLVTAAHALEKNKGQTVIVVLRQPKQDGAFERRDHTIPIRRDGKPLWVRHGQQDLAVLRLADPFPVPVGVLPVSAIADTDRLKLAGIQICSPLFVLTYPQQFEANGAAFPVARQGIVASPLLFPLANHPTFLADFTTFAGDSGGPVFVSGADGHPLLVGVVLAQFRHDEQVTSEYEERTIHHPLGLGTVLHAQFVRDTVEAAAKAQAPSAK